MIENVLTTIKQMLGYTAIGLRLKSGIDFPYLAQEGFSSDFMKSENLLHAHSCDGNVCTDKEGNPILECTCGFVVSQANDLKNTLLTNAGTFYTNNSFELLSLADDPRFRPRNKCIAHGYQSFAIFPIKAGNKIIGTLQINEKQKDAFDKETIHFFESICLNIGIELMRKDAEEKLIEANLELAKQNEEKIKHAAELIIAQELAIQNAEKAKLTDQLLTANKELHQYTYIASHDLQEPLRTVSNYMQLFEDDYHDKLDEKGHKYLASVNKATKRMSALIKSLLDFSRLGQNSKLKQIHLDNLIKEVLIDLNSLIIKSNAVLEIGTLPQIMGYEIELRQLFQNMISNAIKFQKKGEIPFIKISSNELVDCWEFSIEDNGIGIETEHYDRIFEIFQRLHKNETEYEGKGIGLANCKKIIQLHKGKIWLSSKPGSGTTFFFTLNKSIL